MSSIKFKTHSTPVPLWGLYGRNNQSKNKETKTYSTIIICKGGNPLDNLYFIIDVIKEDDVYHIENYNGETFPKKTLEDVSQWIVSVLKDIANTHIIDSEHQKLKTINELNNYSCVDFLKKIMNT